MPGRSVCFEYTTLLSCLVPILFTLEKVFIDCIVRGVFTQDYEPGVWCVSVWVGMLISLNQVYMELCAWEITVYVNTRRRLVRTCL